jgi:hypothetical protein
MTDWFFYVAVFWAVIIGVPLLIIAWKQVLVIFGIPLGLLFLVALFAGKWTFDGGPELQRLLGQIIMLPIVCFGVYAMIVDLYKSSKERYQRRRAKKLENL